MVISINSKKFGVHSVLIDDEDHLKIQGYKWHIIKIGGCFYAEACVGKKRIRMHRLILAAKKGEIVDHVNHNGLDNTRVNLRFATTSQNSMNQRMRKNNASGFRGVYFHKRALKYHAQIKVDGKRKSLGLFYNPTEAAIAYNKAAHTFYGDYANVNLV